MANKKFCLCGFGTEYSIIPPKFCASCGTSYNTSFGTIVTPKSKIRIPPKPKQEIIEDDYEEDDEDDELEEEELPRQKRRRSNYNTKELLAGTEIHSGYSGVSIKDVAGTKDKDSDGFQREKPKKMSQKQALEEFKRLATPRRQRVDLDTEQ